MHLNECRETGYVKESIEYIYTIESINMFLFMQVNAPSFSKSIKHDCTTTPTQFDSCYQLPEPLHLHANALANDDVIMAF